MVVLNHTGGEINAKIVYYGPGVSGKTTNLEYIHEKTPNNAKGKMVSMKTQTDRTLFFDFLPLELGEINNYRTRFLLYTVPGQVYYNATRKLVLKGVDAVVFVADSSRSKLDENLESLRNLEQNLNEHGLSLDDIPWVIQYNKRDIDDAVPVAELETRLNPLKKPSFEAVATRGTGVYETFHAIATMVYRVLKDRLEKGDLAAEIGERTPAIESKRATAPTAARPRPEQAPPAARTPARPAPERKSPVPPTPVPAPEAREEKTPAEAFEFDDHVDLMLREVDAPSAKAPAAKKGERASVMPPTAPPPRRAKEAPESPPRPQRAHGAPAPTPPAAESPADENLFAAIPEAPFDLELGRLPSLDEASIASEEARREGPDEFVTDPMRRAEPKAAPVPAPARDTRAPAAKPAPPESRPKRDAAPAATQTVERPLRDDESEETALDEVRLEVPVVVTRAQLESGAPVRIVVDVKVVD
jgi:hypothetical protein